MSHDPLEHTLAASGAAPGDDTRALQRRVFALSAFCFLVLLVGIAIFHPRGIDSARTAARQLLTHASVARRDIGWSEAPGFTLAGFAAGILAGLLGMGGGVMKISCMLLVFRLDILFARAISLVTMFFSSLSAYWHYARQRLIDWNHATPMLVLAIPGAAIGAFFGNTLRGARLTHLFAFFMIFLAFNTLALALADPRERVLSGREDEPHGPDAPASLYGSGVIGALHGAVCGVLGVSGGVIATPLQQMLLRVPLRRAIAHTLLVSTVATAVASVIVLWAGAARGDFRLGQVFFVDLFMGTGAALGAPLGARLSNICNPFLLRLIFAGVAMTAGLSIVF